MPCPTHDHGDGGRPIEAARPPGEDAAIEQEANTLADTLEPIHEAVLEGVTGEDSATTEIALGSLPAVRRAVTTRFATRDRPFRQAFVAMVARGADLGRAAAVRRYSLSTSPTFGDAVDGSAIDLPSGDPVWNDLRQSARRAHRAVQPRMVDDLSEAIYEASESGLSRDEIRDRLASNVLPQARGYESRRIATTEVSAGSNRGALSAYEDADRAEKQWQAVLDLSTRPSHARTSGNSVPLESTFDVDGYPARYPGDSRLPPRLRIACRCWLVIPTS